MGGRSGRAAIAAIFAATGAAAGQAGPVPEQNPPAEQRILPYQGQAPACADFGVLGVIAQDFSSRERNYWESPLEIVRFETVSETGFRSNGASYIPRRYCHGDALFSDGVVRHVKYNIAEALGFIGVGSGVTWCVVGLDRNYAFSPKCRAAGP